MQNAHLLTAFLFVFYIPPLFAQSFNTVDLNFGEDGKFLSPALCDLGVIQPDGKLIFYGSVSPSYNSFFHFLAISRFEPDGEVDVDFGNNGTMVLEIPDSNSFVEQVFFLPEGKLLALAKKRRIGSTDDDYILLRLNSDGSLEETYGINGKVNLPDIDNITSGILQADGKLLLAGFMRDTAYNESTFMVRYNIDGTLDQTFSDNGRFMTNVWAEYARPEAIKIANDEDVLLCMNQGRSFFGDDLEIIIFKLNKNGHLDTNFGETGEASFSLENGGGSAIKMIIQPDEKILILGNSYQEFDRNALFIRYLPDGQLDATFGQNGYTIKGIYKNEESFYASDEFMSDFIVLADKSILVTGRSELLSGQSDAIVMKFLSDGNADMEYGVEGVFKFDFEEEISRIYSINQQFENQFVIQASTSESNNTAPTQFMQRYLTDFSVGTIDFATKLNNALVYPNPLQEETILEYTLENPETLTIQLTDLNGRILKTYLQNQLQKAGDYQQAIDLPNNLPKGFYLLRLASGNGQFVIKVVK